MNIYSYEITLSKCRKVFALVSVGVLMMLSLCGCFVRGLIKNEGDQTKVEIRFDWSNVEGAIPKDMSIWFFPKNPKDKNYKAVRRDISVVQGGSAIVSVPIGEYDVICVNNDPGRLDYQNDSNPYEFQVVIKGDESAGKKVQRKGGNTRGETDRPMGVWCDCTSNQDFVLSAETYPIMLKPEAVAVPINIDLTVKDRLGDLKSMSGALVDAHYVYKPFEKKVVEDVRNLDFKMPVNVAARKITAATQCFNHPHSNECLHRLEFYCEMNNGIKYTYAFNIKEEVKVSKDGMQVDLVKSEFKLPVGQDFSFKIKDWGVIEIDP